MFCQKSRKKQPSPHLGQKFPILMTILAIMDIFQGNNQRVLTTKPLEDVVQGHSIQVKDLIEAKKGRAATAGKAGKVWSLPKFWISVCSYKKQLVKKF